MLLITEVTKAYAPRFKAAQTLIGEIMKSNTLILLLASFTGLIGCDLPTPDDHNMHRSISNTNTDKELNVDIAALLAREVEIVEHSPKSSNTLAFDLYKQFAAQDKNPTFSPFSLSLALAMTYAGAAAETEKAMKDVLYYGENNPEFHKSYGDFANLLSHKDRSKDGTVLKISNALWLDDHSDVLDSFKNTLAEGYRAKPTQLDFCHEAKAATNEINQTVSDQTNKEIDKLLKEVLSTDTRFILTNAMYFKSNWLEPFNARNTQEGEFLKSDGSDMKTKYMKQKAQLLYGEDAQKQYLMVPYKDSDFATLFVLPREGQLKTVEENLNDANFNAMLKNLSSKDVSFWLPKFSQRMSPDVKAALKAQGLGIIFDDKLANLTKINDRSKGEGNLYVGDVVHEAVVKMYEEGTTAAAATAVVVFEATSMQPNPTPVTNFHADHPFLFNIIHKPSNTILFMGRVDEPTLD